MKWEELVNIMQFFIDPDNKNGITIQLGYYRDIPYVKRTIRGMLGEPDRQLGHDMYYGGKAIRFRPLATEESLDRNSYESEVDPMFFLERDDESEWLEHPTLSKLAHINNRINDIELWKACGLTVPEMYRALRNNGACDIAAFWTLQEWGLVKRCSPEVGGC